MERASSKAVHVVHGGSHYGFSGSAVLVVGIGGGLVATFLLRAKFVTRAHLASAVSTVKEGVNGVGQAVESLRRTVGERLEFITGRIERSIGQGEELKQQVDELSDELGAVRKAVVGCEQHLMESSLKQDVTMRGIALLCGEHESILGFCIVFP